MNQQEQNNPTPFPFSQDWISQLQNKLFAQIAADAERMHQEARAHRARIREAQDEVIRSVNGSKK